MTQTATAPAPTKASVYQAKGAPNRRLQFAVMWEVIIIASVLLIFTLHPAGIAAGAILLIASLVLGVPFGGMTMAERINRKHLFGRRRREFVAQPNMPSDLVPIGQWLPELSVKQTKSARNHDVGVITDGKSWTALLGVTSDDNLIAERDATIDLGALKGLTVQEEIVFASLQLLTYTVPAPSKTMLIEGSAAIESYFEITDTHVPPAVRRTWLGVRLDPNLCLEAITSRGYSQDGIYGTLGFGLHRVQSALKRQGIATSELTAGDVLEVLALNSGASPDPIHDDRTEELWDAWKCDGFYHCSRSITDWGEDPSAAYQTLLDILANAPTVFSVSSFTLDRYDQAAGALRLCGINKDATSKLLDQIAEQLGSSVQFGKRGGDQVPTVLATLPLGREVLRR